MENRRHFTRILCTINAELEIDEHLHTVSLLDISLNGALVTIPTTTRSLLKKIGILRFQLAPDDNAVVMHIAVVHIHENEMGLRVNAVDIDSISYIRRLIELNLGDEQQLNKELSQLTINE